MIPRFKPALGVKEIKAALSRASSDDVKIFEDEFASLMGQKYALAFPYGRTGLMLLMEALGLKNQEIICPAYTCVVVPHAIVYSGNIPVFIDCAQGDFNMDLDLVEAAISEKTGAIIATSIFGYPVNLDKLERIREKYPHVKIIQDCAHSFAAEWKGRQVQKEGVAAVFGLNISKLLTSIFGGMITTDDETIYLKLKKIRAKRIKKATNKKSIKRFFYLLAVYPAFWNPVYCLINRLERSGFLDRFSKYYDEAVIDMPVDYLEGMTGLEARVGITNIERYSKVIDNRRKLALSYIDVLDQSNNHFVLPELVEGATYSHFVVMVDSRDRWLNRGISEGVQFGWLIDYCIPEMKSYEHGSKSEFPTAAKYARGVINLPLGCKYKDSEAVANCIKRSMCS